MSHKSEYPLLAAIVEGAKDQPQGEFRLPDLKGQFIRALPSDPTILHYVGCTADYPEKPEGEPAQSRTWVDLGDDGGIWSCNDCGATVMVSRETEGDDHGA